MKENFTQDDLQIGDILIFEDFGFSLSKFFEKIKNGGTMGGAYYLLHYLIAWFDPGKEGANYRNIYHAGIWGNVDVNRDNGKNPEFKDCVVQAGTTGIGHASIESTLHHETVMNVYVCRLKNRSDSFISEINDSIREFYKVKGNYSFETAWLLAVICSMRYSQGKLFDMLRVKVGSVAAHFIMEAVLNMINQYNDDHQRDMVACSTLVAMMYKNAGHELPVHVFETSPIELEEPNFQLPDGKELEKMPDLKTSVTNEATEWPTLKETLVTPRQLMESPDVELVGVLHHKP